jgi:polyisoprenoid-binding protein YceI
MGAEGSIYATSFILTKPHGTRRLGCGGTTSGGKTVKLTNRGQGTLTIAGITTTSSYSQTNKCGTSLGSNKSCTITVKFTPSAWGIENGTLSLKDNAASSPQKVSLTGVGT